MVHFTCDKTKAPTVSLWLLQLGIFTRDVRLLIAFKQLDPLSYVQIQQSNVGLGGLGALSKESYTYILDLDRDDGIELLRLRVIVPKIRVPEMAEGLRRTKFPLSLGKVPGNLGFSGQFISVMSRASLTVTRILLTFGTGPSLSEGGFQKHGRLVRPAAWF